MIELLLTGLVPAPIEQQTIKIIEEQPPAQVQEVEPPELTLEQKIKTNFYNCNTDTEWIRADNAQCLTKRTTQPQKAIKTPVNGSQGLNGYAYPSCTGHVALKRYVPQGWGNASNWRYAAQQSGWTVSSIPTVGAIGWRYGHVVYVEAVHSNGTVTISENNYDWKGSTRTITIPNSQYTYLY